jgi:UDP:flavonoid glycosyltransferase YjiC (YdhE family)
MIALPLFWDQYDNAQRVEETGFGVRLATYEFADAELTTAIDRLHADAGLAERMAPIAAAAQSSPGTVRAADLIERVVRETSPASR